MSDELITKQMTMSRKPRKNISMGVFQLTFEHNAFEVLTSIKRISLVINAHVQSCESILQFFVQDLCYILNQPARFEPTNR